jgi:hypothetical protein
LSYTEIQQLLVKISERAKAIAKTSNLSNFPDLSFLAKVVEQLRSHEHIDEREVIPLSATERKIFVAATSEVLFPEWKLPPYMLKGTDYTPITNLKDGLAHPRSHGGGYLVLESFNAIARAAEKDEDAKSWMGLAGDRVFTPRTLDQFDVMMHSILANIGKANPPLYFKEALAIYRELKDGWYPPWSMGERRGRRYTKKAKDAPVMTGCYFSDMLWLDHKHAIGMIPPSFGMRKVLELRRKMLKEGYFNSVLTTKKIKDVMVKLCGEDVDFKTAISSQSGEIIGVGVKKCFNLIDVEESVMNDLSSWPELMQFVKKESDTISLTKRLVGLMHITSSANFLWTDTPIVAARSQFSKVAEIFEPPRPKTVDAESGHIYEYYTKHDPVYQAIDSLYADLPCPSDLNSSFIRDLTTNSAGVLPSSVEEKISDLPQVLQKLARSKIGLVAIFGETLNDYDTIIEQLNNPTRTLFREQILRRPRLVAGVDIAKQLAPHVGKRISKTIYGRNPTFVSGKTDNSAGDARLQLRGTGTPNVLNIYSDVPSFDGSDSLPIQEYVRSKYMASVKNYDVMGKYKGYFAVPPTPRRIYTYNEVGEIIHSSIAAVSSPWTAWRLASSTTPYNVIRGDDRRIDLSSATLQSGLFDTSIQGSTITGSVGKCVQEEFSAQSPETANSGDDFAGLLASFDYAKDAREVGEYIRARMAAVGFSAENNFSSIFSEFLQIGALCGQVLSYGHRLSPFTAERFDARHPLDNYGSTFGIFAEELGRCHFPDELTRRMHTFAFVASHLRASFNCKDRTARKTRSGMHIKIPQCAMYMRYNVPFPSFKGGIPSSSFAFGGESKKFELFAQVFGLRSTDEARKDDETMVGVIINNLSKYFGVATDDPVVFANLEKGKKKLIRSGFFERNVLKRIDPSKASLIDLKRTLVYSKINVAVAPDRSTFDETDLALIEKYAQNIDNQLDKDKYRASAAADYRVRELGVNIPDRLLYHRTNFFKLTGAYAAAISGEDYWARMDSFIDSEFVRLIQKSIPDLFDGRLPLFDVGVDVNRERQVLDPKIVSALRVTAPAPYTMLSEDGRLCMARCGTSGVRTNSIAVLDRATEFDYLSNNTQAWERIVREIAISPEPATAALLTATAVGLDEKETEVLNTLVSESILSPGGILHITTNKRARFWLSDDAQGVVFQVSDANEVLSEHEPALQRTGMAIALMLEGIWGSAAGASSFRMYFPGVWAGLAIRQSTF